MYIQAQADQQAGPLRQKIEEKRQQRAAAAAVTPTASVAAPLLPPPLVDDKKSGGEERKERERDPGRKQWGDPVAMPTLVRRPSVTAVVTEGKGLVGPIFKFSKIIEGFLGEHCPIFCC